MTIIDMTDPNDLTSLIDRLKAERDEAEDRIQNFKAKVEAECAEAVEAGRWAAREWAAIVDIHEFRNVANFLAGADVGIDRMRKFMTARVTSLRNRRDETAKAWHDGFRQIVQELQVGLGE